MTTLPFFRKEVLEHTQHRHLGRVFLNVPFPNSRFVAIWSIFILLGLILLLNEEYVEQWSLRGVVDAAGGVSHVYAASPGVVKKIQLKEGAHVRDGEILLVIDTHADEGTRAQSKKIQDTFKARLQIMRQTLHKKQQFLEKLRPLLQKKYIAKSFFDQKAEEIGLLKNQIHTLEADEARFYQTKTLFIKSPIAGVVSSVMVHVGQHVSQDKPLFSVLPENPNYVAQLYVPVQKAGFLKPNDDLFLHYDAYPYRRFGSGKAIVTSISQTVLTDKEENKLFEIHQPYYKATANLNALVIGQGHALYPIHQGMTFDAVATGERRKIWQWLLGVGGRA